MKGFDETQETARRKAPTPAETADSSALGLASAVGNQGMQRIAASSQAGRVGPAALSTSGGVLARSSSEAELDEDTGDEGGGGGSEPVVPPAPHGADEGAGSAEAAAGPGGGAGWEAVQDEDEGSD